MLVRLALEDDEDAIVEMARINAEQTMAHHVFRPERVREIVRQYLDTASPTLWVVEDRRKIVGFMQASLHLYDFTDGFFVSQQVLFVRPEHRGTRAAVHLVKELIAWAERLGAKEITGGNDNGFNSDRTARFLSHFGFETVGIYMRRAVGNGEKGRNERSGAGAE